MKLSEIEAVGKVVLVKEPGWSTVQANLNQFDDLKDGELLYTADRVMEFAKAKVLEALRKYGVQAEEWSDYEVELAYKQMTKFIFEEDTKND